jgi:hypothetical protein
VRHWRKQFWSFSDHILLKHLRKTAHYSVRLKLGGIPKKRLFLTFTLVRKKDAPHPCILLLPRQKGGVHHSFMKHEPSEITKVNHAWLGKRWDWGEIHSFYDHVRVCDIGENSFDRFPIAYRFSEKSIFDMHAPLHYSYLTITTEVKRGSTLPVYETWTERDYEAEPRVVRKKMRFILWSCSGVRHWRKQFWQFSDRILLKHLRNTCL